MYTLRKIVLYLFSLVFLPSIVSSLRVRRFHSDASPPIHHRSYSDSAQFTTAAIDDSVEVQTIFKDMDMCDDPSKITVDRLDSNNLLIDCGERLIQLQTMVLANISGSTRLGQSARVLAEFDGPGTLVQLTNSVGDLLLNGGSIFYLTDRLGISPLRPFPVPNQLFIDSMVVDEPIAGVSTDASSSIPQDGYVYFISYASSSIDRIVFRMQVNYQNPNQSIFEPLLPIEYTTDLSPQHLHIQPKIHILHLVSDSLVVECDLLTNATRTVFNRSSVDAQDASVFAVAMDNDVADGDSLDVMFVSMAYYSASTSVSIPLIYRVFRKTLQWDVVVTSTTCMNSALRSFTYQAIEQTLFLSCASRFVAAASFNGSISDPSTSITSRPITNGILCDPAYVVRIANTPPNVGTDFARLIVSCAFEGSLIMTTGASLQSTVSYSMCVTPTVVSSQLDEFGRQVLLHTCADLNAAPVAVVDEVPKVLTSLSELTTVFHRAGTSQIYALCQFNSIYIASVNTDGTNPQRPFVCPASSNVSQSYMPLVAISNNSTLIISCGTDLWLLPLDTASDATLLWSVPVPKNGISTIIASSHFVFAGLLPRLTDYYAINLVSGSANEFEATDVFVDEAGGAVWISKYTGSNECCIFRQQPIGDVSPAASQMFLNSTSSPRTWLVDASTNSLVVLNDLQILFIQAYNITGDMARAATRSLPVLPTCMLEYTNSQSQQLSVHHNLGLLLLECDSDWVIVGLPIQVLSNVNAAAQWLPVLRSTSACKNLNGPFVIGARASGVYISCDMSNHLSLNFQCSDGEQWFLGGCENCNIGWSKQATIADVPSTSLVIPSCLPCAPGSIAISPGTIKCSLCVAGTYHDSSLGEVCRPCPIGTYQNLSGTTECLQCQPGTYAPSQGSVSCSTCPLGSLPDLLAVTCVPCPKDSYAPNTTSPQCLSCEGAHQAGLACSNGLASVKEGYFGVLVSESDGSIVLPSDRTGVFHSASCPNSYCPGSPLQLTNSNVSSAEANFCPADDPQPGPIHYCCWPRLNSPDNLLCANCVEGHIAWSSRCVSCSGPNGGLISLVLIFSVALIAWLYSNATDSSEANQTNTSGHVAALLYFIQICSLQMGRASDWLQWMHWSNLSASSTSGCIALLDAYQQTAFNLAVPLLLTGIMLFIAVLHWLYDRCCSKSVNDAELDVHRSVGPVQRSPSELNEPFITIDSGSRDNLDEFVNHAEAEEAENDSINSASVSVSSANNVASTFLSFWSPLSGCYSSMAWYWNAFVLARRASFSVAAVFLADSAVSRLLVFTLMHFLSLLTHQYAAPYKVTVLNSIDSWSHSVLLILSVLLSLQPAPYPVWFEVLIVLVVVMSVLSMVCWIAWIKLKPLLALKAQSKSMQSQSGSRSSRLVRVLFTPPSFSLHRYFRTFLLVLLFCYTSVTSTVAAFLRCVDVASDVRLVFDTPTMDCRSDRYHTYRAWIIMVLSVYTIGFPLASLALLAWNRRTKSYPEWIVH